MDIPFNHLSNHTPTPSHHSFASPRKLLVFPLLQKSNAQVCLRLREYENRKLPENSRLHQTLQAETALLSMHPLALRTISCAVIAFLNFLCSSMYTCSNRARNFLSQLLHPCIIYDQ